MKTLTKWMPILGMYTYEADKLYKQKDPDTLFTFITYQACCCIFVMVFIAINVIVY